MREITVKPLNHRGERFLVITVTSPRRNRDARVRQMWLREDEAALLAGLLALKLPAVTKSG